MNSENNKLPGFSQEQKSAEEMMADFDIQLHKLYHDKKFVEAQLNELLLNLDPATDSEEEPNPEIDKWLDKLSMVMKEINKYTVLVDSKELQPGKKVR